MKVKGLIGLCFLLVSCLDTDIAISSYDQWVKDVKTIDNYLAAHSISTINDASGVRIEIIELGTAGLPPNDENSVKINYVGKLLSNGSIFDQGTTYLPLSQYVQGWRIALPMLPAGSKARLYIPSFYGYGTNGTNGIPANANLIFDVDLESVTPTDAQKARFTSDTTAIKTYLANNLVTATQSDSGIWYNFIQNGTGLAPASIYNQVRFHYTVKEMASEGKVFLENVLIEPNPDFSSRLANLPQGVMLGLQLMQEGDKAVFYVPSVLGYGPRGLSYGTAKIPANARLIIEIELLEVIL